MTGEELLLWLTTVLSKNRAHSRKIRIKASDDYGAKLFIDMGDNTEVVADLETLTRGEDDL